MSIAGGVSRAVDRGASIGCQSIQIFLKNNMQWDGPPLASDEIKRFRQQREQAGIEPVFAHSSYLINLCATRPAFLRRSIRALIDEIERAALLGVPFIVLHPGSHMGRGEPAGLARVAESLDEVFRATARKKVRIALETTAGQGSNLGYCVEHLAAIYRLVKRPQRLAVCVDTCHVFAAGYDIRNRAGYRRLVRDLDNAVGIDQVVAFHLNDSKTPLNARRDRHEHIGQGKIGLAGFRQVLNDRRWRGLPMVLETPKSEDLHEDVANLRRLQRLMK